MDEIAAEVDRERSTVYRSVQRLLNGWYARMGQLIQEFEDTYGDRIERSSRIEG